MKNVLFFVLLFTSTTGWAQTPAAHKTDSTTYTVPDQMPQYPGGDTALNNFLKKNIHYPDDAVRARIDGTVYISFVVNADGVIDEVTLLSDIGDGCGDEAVRVVKLMPNWIPGKQNGHTVSVKYYLPLRFQLSFPQGVTGVVAIYK